MEEGAIGANNSSTLKVMDDLNSDENKHNVSDSKKENEMGNVTTSDDGINSEEMDDEEVDFKESSEAAKKETSEDDENNEAYDTKEIEGSDAENVQVDDKDGQERAVNYIGEGSEENKNRLSGKHEQQNRRDSRTVKSVSKNTKEKSVGKKEAREEITGKSKGMIRHQLQKNDKAGEELPSGDENEEMEKNVNKDDKTGASDEKTVTNGHDDTDKKPEQKGKSVGSTKKMITPKDISDDVPMKDEKDVVVSEEEQEKKTEPKSKIVESTPRSSAADRPVRERKSVERLVVSTEREVVKEFHIEKGRGTPLKDIPNVAYKLSKRKADDTIKILHAIFFGRRGKAFQIKQNILHFSGFVWHQDEEKNTSKVREKLDKCTKEKLFEFCEILDVQVTKTTTKKEDIVTKLMDFLLAPCSTTAVLLSEKEQSSRTKKRKRTAKSAATLPKSRSTHSNQHSGKSVIKSLEESKESDKNHPESETEEEPKGKVEIEKEICNSKSGDVEAEEDDDKQMSSGDKIETMSEIRDHDGGMKKTPARRGRRPTTKNEPTVVSSKPKASGSSNKPSPSSDKKHEKGDHGGDTAPRVFSRKKKDEKPVKEKRSSSVTVINKGKRQASSMPTDDELRERISEILKDVDFNTATFTDILKQLVGYFGMDLSPRKASIKLMIQDELTKLAEEEEGDDDDVDDTTTMDGVEKTPS